MEKDIRPCIPIKNKYSSVVLPIVLLVVDYIAIYLAESVSVSVRNCVMTGTYFQLSWLSTHVIVPFVFCCSCKSMDYIRNGCNFGASFRIFLKSISIPS